MKLFMFIVTWFFILPAICQNLVPNGDFKKYDETTGRPADWLFNRYNEVVEEGPDGSLALRMTSYYRSKDGAWKANAMTDIPKISAGTWKFSLKANGRANRIYYFLIPEQKMGKSVCRDFRKNAMKSLEHGWKTGEYRITFPKDQQNVKLVLECFFLNRDEYEELADIRLEPVPEK